jgi:Leucine-rich repeat (LRR) protein
VNLSSLDFSDNPVTDLLPLSELKTLVTIRGKRTQVSDLSVLRENELLELLDLEFSPVKSVLPMVGMPNLKYLNVNGGQIASEEAPEFLIQRPDITLIYRTEELNSWWANLDGQWKDLLRKQFSLSENPSVDELHQLTQKSELAFERVGISDLQPLTVFSNLRSLTLFDAPVSSVSPLSGMKLLSKLKLSQIPVMDFLPLSGLTGLVDLDISNTGIGDLAPISNLFELKKLNLSGTNVKSLKGLETLVALEELDVANTGLRSLKPIEGLSNLKKLSCFNTNMNSRAVDSFKASHPNCEVRFY